MRKVGNVIKNTMTVLIVLFAVCLLIFTIISVSTVKRNDRSLFGYKAYIVLSDSMSKTDFDIDDLIITKEVDPSTLKVGDIISYQSANAENYGETVTHKIRELTQDTEGNPGFITYGTTTGKDDKGIVTYEFVLGKYQMTIPGVGRFFRFLRTVPGYMICIFMPMVILIILYGISSIRLFRQYRQEQIEEFQAERKALAAERMELQKLKEELLQIKETTQKQEMLRESSEDAVQKGYGTK